VEQTYQPIDCGLYDYLEVACLHGYEVALHLRGGECVQGIAHTTQAKNAAEFLLIKAGSEVHHVRLDKLLRLVVLSEPRAFSEVVFASGLSG